MKVKDLMTRLSEMPPEANVCSWYDGDAMDVEHCYMSNGGDVVIAPDRPYFYAEIDAGKEWEFKNVRWEPKCAS